MRKGWLLLGGATGLTVLYLAAFPLATEDAAVSFSALHREDAEHHVPDRQRDDLLKRARVWHRVDRQRYPLNSNPPDPTGLLSRDVVRCRFLPKAADGTTPKFRCVLEDGEVIKVKYGRTGEVPAEVAASRLVGALGFGADQMYIVPDVRCYGCPRFPFHIVRALDMIGMRELFARAIPDDRYVDFRWAAVERHFEGDEITASTEGWSWYELEHVDPAQGASRAELDALRLLARFLGHWDNKASNQRLVCRPPGVTEHGGCAEPFAFMHDLGATFGPNKVDLASWRAHPIWADREGCRVTMRDYPYHGGTFADRTISEEGRQFLAAELTALSDTDIASLFHAARFPAHHSSSDEGADVTAWARAFRDKRQQIAGGAACPPVTN